MSRQPDLFEQAPASPQPPIRVVAVLEAPEPVRPTAVMLRCPNRACGRKVEQGFGCVCGRGWYAIWLMNKWGLA